MPQPRGQADSMRGQIYAPARIYAERVDAYSGDLPSNEILHGADRQPGAAGRALPGSYIYLWQGKVPIPSGADQDR